MTMEFPHSGVFAALATPIHVDGRPDIETFGRVVEFVAERGVDGVVIGGGTGEYPHFSEEERTAVLARAVRLLRGERTVIASIGTSSIFSTLRLAHCAVDCGADALLIPMPHFFQYQQEDMISFCESVCADIAVPCLLYNLPSFTGGVTVDTAIHLLSNIPNLIGMKDSSGDRGHLEPLARARVNGKFSLFVGDDSLLLDALRAGWNGVISGIACFVPELIRAVYDAHKSGDVERSGRLQKMLDQVIEHVVSLPIPWGVRVGLAARGVSNGPMHVSPSANRLRQMQDLCSWLTTWAADRGMKLRDVWTDVA